MSAKRLERESLALRVLWMLVFAAVWMFAEILLGFLVVVQLICRIAQGAPHEALRRFGDSLSQYFMQIGRFGSFQTEDKPWPFADWPAPVDHEDPQ